MEPLRKLILRIASLAAIITFVTCALNGISLMTSIFRSAVVYLLTILLAVIMLNILRWGVLATSPPDTLPKKQERKEQTEKKSE
ncbi:hypothetical protein [Caldithrix abyssi]|uniref:Uncharacterized protein n=2 Tax=Caldithrix abyssi DSM 13497 TaxID=880073 RepID=H1XQ15_CALAY|nr:hypothetical protein [Caldithrix abyssi]EHO42266.1 hypothetical protein Calab_2656 [Caldithrix abyssi DSM 13497]